MKFRASTGDPTPLLLISGDPGVQSHLAALMPDFRVVAAVSRAETAPLMRRERPHVALLDLKWPIDGGAPAGALSLLSELLAKSSSTRFIALVDEGERELAARAIGLGATDFYHRPLEQAVLPLILRRACRIGELEERAGALRAGLPGAMSAAGLIGSSTAIREAFRLVEKLAPARASVLLHGESGTGKELLARALHDLGERARGPFCAINCAAIPENLLESELFGYERGAFTGAVRQTPGRLELAAGGTVFLDEVGEMAPSLQAKLLRVLQERVVERIGGRVTIPLDIRFVCATNKKLSALIRAQKFREDLYYRIAEVIVEVPPLRERGEDALLLARHFLRECSAANRSRARSFTQDALRAIQESVWPGNVRELQNAVNRAAIMAEGACISAADLGLEALNPSAALPTLREARRNAERAAVEQALAVSSGNLSRAAQHLGITRPTLYDLLGRLKVEPAQYGGQGPAAVSAG
jgi:two-component system NtrC family response regulator